MNSIASILDIHNLSKRYGDLQAVKTISFSINRGVCFGLLGPNGAGKTTTIEMIEGVTAPTAGEILYKGKPRAAAFKESVGIKFQETALPSFLTVRETLATFQALYRDPDDMDVLIDLCHLKGVIDQPNDKVSGGQKQRLFLALSLINKPDLLFLDEPSIGLDPQARWDLWNIVETIKAQGKTVIITTHYMEEAQRLCDEIAIMDHGGIIAQGTPETLISKYTGGETLILPERHLRSPLTRLSLPYRRVGSQVEIEVADMNTCLADLMQHNVDLTGMTVRRPTLETVFLNLTGRKLRD